ncbi:hypothetical protein FKP32DRAFT_538207 [Trametes sanguinea]|nr:hypothetical protein FKP32DRAFT_538207 [Trametes sanguinea]
MSVAIRPPTRTPLTHSYSSSVSKIASGYHMSEHIRIIHRSSHISHSFAQPVMSEAQDLSDLVATYYTDTVYQYFEISSLTLLGYHYVLTIEEEIEQISRQKFTSSTVIYLANRYLPLAVIIYQWSPVSNGLKACLAEERSFVTLQALQYFVWAAFSALLHQPGYNSAPLLSRIPLVFADLAVIVITWKTQYNDHKLGAIVARKGRPSLATVLYHNGIKYFAVLTLLNIPQILTACFVAIPTSPEYMVAGMIQFIEPLTAILVASFLTDLRKAAEARTYQASLASFGSLDFRVVGSLGASLHAAQDVDVGRQGSAAEVEQEEIAPVRAEGMDSWATESASAMA